MYIKGIQGLHVPIEYRTYMVIYFYNKNKSNTYGIECLDTLKNTLSNSLFSFHKTYKKYYYRKTNKLLLQFNGEFINALEDSNTRKKLKATFDELNNSLFQNSLKLKIEKHSFSEILANVKNRGLLKSYFKYSLLITFPYKLQDLSASQTMTIIKLLRILRNEITDSKLNTNHTELI